VCDAALKVESKVLQRAISSMIYTHKNDLIDGIRFIRSCKTGDNSGTSPDITVDYDVTECFSCIAAAAQRKAENEAEAAAKVAAQKKAAEDAAAAAALEREQEAAAAAAATAAAGIFRSMSMYLFRCMSVYLSRSMSIYRYRSSSGSRYVCVRACVCVAAASRFLVRFYLLRYD
jgi:hypothetical protein